MLQIDSLSKSYGNRLLFDRISFKVNSKERVGLVGLNGHGKTTLFRLITGEESPDEGSLSVPRNYRIGYVRQSLQFQGGTVLEEAADALPAQQEGQLWRVEKILAGLGFGAEDLHRPPSELSGGFQVRLNLARAMLAEPDLLLLDEPTNFLDITSIRWIERYLSSWPRELMLITHDRSFMDKVVTHIVGIHRQKVRKIAGDTGKYYHQMAQDEEIYEKTRVNDERRRREVELFISRFRAKARLAGLVQSRIKTLEKMQKKDKLAKIKTLDFQFRSCPFPAKQVLAVDDLDFAYPGQDALIRKFALAVTSGERVCIVGPNGRGKSTLMRLMAGVLNPRRGKIRYHPQVRIGYFEQSNVAELIDSRTVEEEIMAASSDVNYQLARSICGAMLFGGDDALKRIGVLSGGEKSRVMLGRLLAQPVNLLLLDEPTNHLDMESCDALLAAVDSFEGAVIMVTHNEMFLHALAERLVIFQNDRIEVFDGSYQAFLDRGGWLAEDGPVPDTTGALSGSGTDARASKKALRRERSAIVSEKSRRLAPLKKQISRLEALIMEKEAALEALNRQMQAASQKGDGRQIAEISRKIHASRTAVNDLFGDLETVATEHDSEEAAYEARLAALEDQLSRDP